MNLTLIQNLQVKDLGCQKQIGLSAFGYKLGRWGNLAWLCICTDKMVYLFDIATLGGYSALHATVNITRSLGKKKTTVDLNENCLENSNTEEIDVNEEICGTDESNHSQDNIIDMVEKVVTNDIPTDDLQPSVPLINADSADSIEEGDNAVNDDRTNAIYKNLHCPSDIGTNTTLAGVLRDSSISKVMHDSRNLMDYFYHNSDVAVNGLVDLQVNIASLLHHLARKDLFNPL